MTLPPRFALGLSLLCSAGLSSAQIPDVLVKLDVLLHYRTEQGGRTTVRAYDSLGRYGTAGLSFTLEPGFQVIISQRFQKIKGNADDDQLDALYIEDRGLWRFGKQLMPFGQNGLLRESVYGGRWETTLGGEGVPASLAACDGGRGLQRGIIGRVGSRLGFSFAVGNRFGIDASSLTVIRSPEDSPGRHRGYREVYGIDFGRKLGRFDVRVEHVRFQKGETDEDESRQVTDITLELEDEPGRKIGVGWSRDSLTRSDFLRLQGSLNLAEGLFLEPILQFKEGEVKRFGVSMRLRL